MQHRRSASLLAVPLLAAVILAACGDDDESDSTTPATTVDGTDGGGEAASLAGDCPETVTIQTDWMPEAEHGWVYQMVGEGYEIDADNAAVEGPLIDAGGNDTGVRIRIQSGGPPQQNEAVSSIMYQNDDILLGFVYTDEAIQFSDEFPTVAIESGLDRNPTMIMWDPATYPDVTGIADLGEKGVTVRYYGGSAYMDFLTGTGVLSKEQVDGSYKGDPQLFITDDGAAAQQGFGSAEPYIYEKELSDWLKPVKYEYVNDLGWLNYAQSIATKPENIETYSACFTKLVPIIQQASVDYLDEPDRSNAIILAAVEEFGDDFGWTYTEGVAEYGVATMKADGLMANGTDGVMGSFDIDRVTDLIDKAVPVYTAQGSPPKDGVTAEDVVTNQFLDPSIGL